MPYDITINSSSTSNISETGSVTFTSIADSAVLNVSELENALSSDNVTVVTGSQGAQAGDLTVASEIDSAATTDLTLTSINYLNIDSAITTGGNLIFVSGAATSLDGVTITATGDQTYDDAVSLAASTTLTSPGSGSVSLDSTLDLGIYNL